MRNRFQAFAFKCALHRYNEGARTAVKLAHWNYIACVATFALNVFSMLVLACGGVKWKGVHMIYALFNLIIYSIVGMYSFYNG